MFVSELKRFVLTIDQAQKLYSAYSTIKTNKALITDMNEIVKLDCRSLIDSYQIRDLFNHLILKYYPNEMSVKSNFINKVLARTKQHVLVYEYPVGNSRVDLCKINGTSYAYEIKTDLDNFERLEKQVNDYLEVFEMVYIVCSEKNLSKARNILPEECGIYTYNVSSRGNYTFKKFKKSIHSNRINSTKQIGVLRKREILQHFSCSQSSSRLEIDSSVLKNHSSKDINETFKLIIKNRYKIQWEFLAANKNNILEIDYQWFFKNTVSPELIYGHSLPLIHQ